MVFRRIHFPAEHCLVSAYLRTLQLEFLNTSLQYSPHGYAITAVRDAYGLVRKNSSQFSYLRRGLQLGKVARYFVRLTGSDCQAKNTGIYQGVVWKKA